MNDMKIVTLDQYSKIATACNEGAVMTVLDPVQGLPTPWRIKLLGIDSDAYRQVERAQQERRIMEMQSSSDKTRRLRGMNAAIVPVDLDGLEEDRIDRLVSCTVGWWYEGWESIEGMEANTLPLSDSEMLAFSQENARKLYSNKAFTWLADQADLFVGSRSNFFKG